MRGVRRATASLHGRSVEELRDRGAQALSAFLERTGSHPDVRPLDEARPLPVADERGRDAERMLARFRARRPASFHPAFDDPAATVAAVRRFAPEAERETLERARRIVAGRFDLLGHRGLDFGAPIDWRLDPISGRRAPDRHWSRVPYLDASAVGDHKVVWELNRHQFLVTLGQAYWLTGDERWARAALRLVDEWIDANPPKRGINWASSLEVALRSVSWVWMLEMLRRSPSLRPRTFGRIVRVLWVAARHLERNLSTWFSPNTHLTGEALGLLYLGTALPELRGAGRWSALGWSILERELSRQLRADGVYFEQSTYYHHYTAAFYLHALVLARRSGVAVPRPVTDRVVALVEHLRHVARPDGLLPLLGDDDGGRLVALDARDGRDVRPTLAIAASVLERPELAAAVDDPGAAPLWLLGPSAHPATRPDPARPAAVASKAFGAGGIYVMRDRVARDADWAVVDCGPHGALSHGHAHADVLSFELCAGGVPMLVDPGTYTYVGPERDAFRGTAAHNALTVDDESSSVPDGMFRWRTVAHASVRRWLAHPRFDYLDGVHDGYRRVAPALRHQREIVFVKGRYWIVRDRLHGRPPRAGARLHFQCDAGVSVRRLAPTALRLERADVAGGVALALETLADGAFAITDGWVSPSFGARARAAHCSLSLPSLDERGVVTVLVPRPVEGAASRRVAAEAGDAYVVRTRAREDLVLARGDAAEARAGGVSSDAAWTIVSRLPDGTPASILAIGGGDVRIDGRRVLEMSRRSWARCRREGAGWRVEAGPPAGED